MKRHQRNLTIVVSSLNPGGAERVAAIQANYWAGRGEHVTVVTLTPSLTPSFYELNENVRHVNVDFGQPILGGISGLKRSYGRHVKLRHVISESRPDCVISHLHVVNIRSILALQGLGIPVIATEHGMAQYSGLSTTWKVLRYVTYLFASAIVVPNIDAIKSLGYSITKKAIEIPNPTDEPSYNLGEVSGILSGRRNIVAIGRLETVKRFDLLLRAFAKLVNHDECILNILGDGPLSDELRELSSQLGIAPRVCFWGNIRGPWQIAKNADLIVLSSEHECFPMVLIEAMANGMAIVSFDCPTGPRKIIRDGIDGVLVPPMDVDELALAMQKLLDDDDERKRLGSEAAKSAGRFFLPVVMDQWDKLIDRVTNSKNESS